MKYTFDKVTRIVISALVITTIFFLINYLSNVLLPFLIGWLIAYLIHPLVNFVQNKMRVQKRGLSIAIAILFVGVVITATFYAVAPMVGHEISRVSTLINEYTVNLSNNGNIPTTINSLFESISQKINLKQVLSLDNIENISKKILPQVWNLLSNSWQVIAGIFLIFIVFLYVIFILLDYQNISEGFIKLIPKKYSHYISDILDDVEIGMNKYFRGQILICAIVGVLFAIGFSIVGIPMAITIGILIGILNIVPYLQTIGLIPVPFLVILQCMETGQNYWIVLLMCLAVFVVVQGLQDMVLVPKIMGKAMGLNPAVILLSLSVWGALMGLVGMIIALPFTTIIVSYYKRYILKQESVPFAEEESHITDSDSINDDTPNNYTDIEEKKN